MVISQT